MFVGLIHTQPPIAKGYSKKSHMGQEEGRVELVTNNDREICYLFSLFISFILKQWLASEMG